MMYSHCNSCKCNLMKSTNFFKNHYANTLSDLNNFESLSANCLSMCLTDIPKVAKP